MPTLSVPNQNVTVLFTQSATLECIPSNPALSIQWVFYQNGGGEGIPITSAGEDIINQPRRNVQLPLIEGVFPYHNITITFADVSIHNGVYVCSVDTQPEDTTVISRNITVNVLPGQLHTLQYYLAICNSYVYMYTCMHAHLYAHIHKHPLYVCMLG